MSRIKVPEERVQDVQMIPTGNTNAKPVKPVPPYVPSIPAEFLLILRGH